MNEQETPKTRNLQKLRVMQLELDIYRICMYAKCQNTVYITHNATKKNTPLVVAAGPPDPQSLVTEGRYLYPRRQLPHLSILRPHQQTSSQRESRWVPHMLESTCCHLPSKMKTQLGLNSALVAQLDVERRK
jgi:hypothetical protein